MTSMRGRIAACGCLLLLAASAAVADNRDIAAAARQQVGVTRSYDPAYRTLKYPGGDVAVDRGVCTDVIVRALRVARGLDLQKAMHEDILATPAAYQHGRRWANRRADANIDHRRVPNQMVWFTRQGYAVAISTQAADYLPGDIVAWDLGAGVLHVGIVSDRRSAAVPLVLHNIGGGAREEDLLFRFRIIGHFRLSPLSDAQGAKIPVGFAH